MLSSCWWDPCDDNSYDNSYGYYYYDDDSDYDSDGSDDILRPRQHAQTIDIP